MADEMPAPADGTLRAVVAGRLSPERSAVDLVLSLGWEATPDGILIPVPLLTVRHV